MKDNPVMVYALVALITGAGLGATALYIPGDGRPLSLLGGLLFGGGVVMAIGLLFSLND